MLSSLDAELLSNYKVLLKVLVPLMRQLLQSSQSFDHRCAARCLKLLNLALLQADTSSHAAQAVAEHTFLQGLLCSTAAFCSVLISLSHSVAAVVQKTSMSRQFASMCGHSVSFTCICNPAVCIFCDTMCMLHHTVGVAGAAATF